jgi:hypothetical protein
MRTPDVLLSGVERKPTSNRHKCHSCGTTFEHRRRGGNVFCSKTCNWSFNGNARKVLYLLNRDETNGLASRAILDFVTQTPSRSYAANIKEIREELDSLDHFLSVNGPDGPSLEAGIKERVDSIRAYLETRTYPNWDEIRAYVRALEILRDTCSDSLEELLLRQSQASAVVCYYWHIRDLPSLARAFQSSTNICRMLGDKRGAKRMTRWAYNLLEEHRSPLSPNSLLVLHQALAWGCNRCSTNGLATKGFSSPGGADFIPASC